MAAGKHYAQQVVLDGVRVEQFGDGWGECPLAVEQVLQLRHKSLGCPLPPQNVNRPVLRDSHQPGRGVFGHAAEFPHLQRTAEGVLDDVLRQRQVVNTEHARQCVDHAPRLTPEDIVARLHHMFNFMTGRTSTPPSTWKMGSPLDSSTASLRSWASISV